MEIFNIFIFFFLSSFLLSVFLLFLPFSFFFFLFDFLFSSFFSLSPLFPFSFYFLSPCNFLFPYRNWERQGCVGGHGVPPRKVWGFGQNRSLISSKHRSNLNCLQALVSNPTSVVSVGLHEKGPQGCCVVSLVLEKITFCAPTCLEGWGTHIPFPQVTRAQERLLSKMPGWREAGLH